MMNAKEILAWDPDFTKVTPEERKRIEEAEREIEKGAKTMNYVIDLTWDNDAAVWIATSDDIPGLVLESGSFDAMVERLRFAVPEMLELNSESHDVLNLTFRSTRHERIAL